MKRIRDLDAVEIRVLGALLEKERMTPDAYPLTVASLIAACNQKSNRDPVTRLTETEVVEALERMRRDVLVWRSQSARAERWSQSVSRRLELEPGGRAVLTVLMLRGPQTVGELRTRCRRLWAFEDLAEVQAALLRMAEDDMSLVAELERRPGQKESRWVHLLSGAAPTVDSAPPERAAPPPAAPSTPGLSERVSALEKEVERLARELRALRDGHQVP